MAKQTKFTDDDLSKKGFIKNAFGQYEKLQKGETIENGNVMVKTIRAGRKPHKEVQEEIYKEKRSKYGVSKKEDRTYNGVVYMSKLEMQYRKHLDKKLLAKEIKKIEEQVSADENKGAVI